MSSPTLKEIKRYLTDNGVDYSDCFERCELVARFQEIRITKEKSAVEALKAKANAAFRRRSTEHAVRLYTDAAVAACALHDIDPAAALNLLVLLLANRSQAFLQLHLPSHAICDAEHCVRLDSAYVKGHARLAAACLALGQITRASEQLEQAGTAPTDLTRQPALMRLP